MRDPKRIPAFLEKLAEVWAKVPDWRFGQFIANFQRWYGRDMFFPEDDKMLKLFEEYINLIVSEG